MIKEVDMKAGTGKEGQGAPTQRTARKGGAKDRATGASSKNEGRREEKRANGRGGSGAGAQGDASAQL